MQNILWSNEMKKMDIKREEKNDTWSNQVSTTRKKNKIPFFHFKAHNNFDSNQMWYGNSILCFIEIIMEKIFVKFNGRWEMCSINGHQKKKNISIHRKWIKCKKFKEKSHSVISLNNNSLTCRRKHTHLLSFVLFIIQ